MRTAALLILCLLARASSAEPPPSWPRFAPATNPLARRLVNEPFQIVEHLRDIDPEVLRQFERLHTDPAVPKEYRLPAPVIADRGGRFEVTDVIVGRAASSNRLIFAGHVPGCWFILYEYGGIAYGHKLVVFRQTHDGDWQAAAEAAGSIGEVRTADFNKLRTSLVRGEWTTLPGRTQEK